ncbi:MAG: hypothetical protein PHE43_00925 [Candidatus Nanoarchaeia archaeon]|nr:hypothetical protein [Candidatus Nanoarchaeia archaeon]
MNKRGEVFPLKDILSIFAFVLILALFFFSLSSSFKKGSDIEEKIITKGVDEDVNLLLINLLKTKVEDQYLSDFVIENEEDESKIIAVMKPLINGYCKINEECLWKMFIDEREIYDEYIVPLGAGYNEDMWEDKMLNQFPIKSEAEVKYPYQDKLVKIKLAIARTEKDE